MKIDDIESLEEYLKKTINHILERSLENTGYQNLTSDGLDSLMIVSLVVTLEEDLGISFSDDHLMIDNFDNIDNIIKVLINYYGVLNLNEI
ncbi:MULTISPECIES: acyl carrier protein [unclassified Planococcus (in: firmicutes)]|uniref:acyl carrier protein n=1 Tax=unclassified Planococcus (in: firmicutes) TaxID=2662419 RepID=UPI000C7E0A60|nr:MULTISPECIES: acyl carrier protein [unclassified Planococcus (in: firmicutes)]PKG48909.1 hypothetical protein CXF66_00015 [Planococcus sp. Urea-trap-24]PKG89684.1 hypothetical protein CXF91_05735 [Planococcus sp. Urea-3u-39]PKH37045.1 hypothetical protein CXF77_12735 [Planococcus sp. MB-3u-09]